MTVPPRPDLAQAPQATPIVDLAQLLGQLSASGSFEHASSVVLRALLTAGERAVARSRWPRARVLRAIVHLRPHGGYRGLRVLEAGAADGGEAQQLPFLPSASAWGWVQRHRRAVAIDVALAMVLPLNTPGAEAFVDEAPAGGLTEAQPGAFGSQESQQRLLGRDCSHVCLFPLRAPGGGLDGAIALEVACEAAIGEAFLWPGAEAELQLIADVATPYLLALPLETSTTPDDSLLPVVGVSMAPIVRTLRVFARQNETVLLQGPTGVGKSRLARWCHERSPRASKPFVIVDLQSMPEEVQMGELFGWKRGAFTSAIADNPGLVARAEGGTLLLDEIDKLSLRAQAGILQLLEDRRYHPLGATGREKEADVRFLVGTNVDLAAAVRAGRFREDLYYRIHVLPIRVPPLRERADEIPGWATFMLERRRKEQGRTERVTLAAEASLKLQTLPWPGNLRQLDNVIRRASSYAMADQADGEDLVVRERHVDAALAAEASGGDTSLPAALRAAAAAFVNEAERRFGEGSPWMMERAEVLRSFVVFSAFSRYNDADKAFRVLGHEALVKHRNHQKVLRRELGKIAELYAELGLVPPAEITAALNRGE